MRTQQTQSSGDSVSEKSTVHIPVLLHEVIHWLDVAPNDVVFDGTLGGGGHALALSSKLSSRGTLIATDVSSKAIARGKEALKDVNAHVVIAHTNFINVKKVCANNNIKHLDKALLDLGWSSDQISQDEKGLSFQKDEPLDMRLSDCSTSDVEHNLTAYEIVNEWREESIADVLFGWGGEKYARRIAKAMVDVRNVEEIKTTLQLVEIIKKATPRAYSYGRLHPATRTFQALRIAVNDEIRVLETALSEIVDVLAPNGRFAVISFHSVEDRVVKHIFKKFVKDGLGEVLTKKPITPGEEEVKVNSRARSAKLRIFSKL